VIVADAKHAFVEHVEEEVKEKKKDRDTYEVSQSSTSSVFPSAVFPMSTAPHLPLFLTTPSGVH
jgi:hypothetical protein